MSVFTNKKIILGICGGIAAYKSAELLRLLIKQGAEVQVVMTRSAQEFVSALTFQALSGRAVRSALFDLDAESGMSHIELARWADLVLVAPASANTIAKIAHGLADDLLSTLCLATHAPLLIAPAMNQQMWLHPATQQNIATLRNFQSLSFCGPAEGEQACGETGPGRMEEPGILLDCCARQLSTPGQNSGFLTGKRFVITAGPTIEDIDPVRYISNRSSGKMGYAIARAARDEGAEVVLVSGPVALDEPEKIEMHRVRSALQMHEKVMQLVNNTDVFIATAAVADYRPIQKADNKIKKKSEQLTIELVKNPDILSDVAALTDKPLAIGFAAETNDLESNAIDKLQRKNLDMIAANQVDDSKGFEKDDNELQLFFNNNWGKLSHRSDIKAIASIKLPYASKQQLARQLIEKIDQLLKSTKEDTE